MFVRKSHRSAVHINQIGTYNTVDERIDWVTPPASPPKRSLRPADRHVPLRSQLCRLRSLASL